jgi:hypothetical protein
MEEEETHMSIAGRSLALSLPISMRKVVISARFLRYAEIAPRAVTTPHGLLSTKMAFFSGRLG